MVISFIKEHKWLSTVFILSIILILKNSSIPYVIEMPLLITLIFDEPEHDFGREVANVIDIFTTAYVTSLIFYYFIDYVPAQRKKKQADEIITPQLDNIGRYMGELIALIEYVIEKQQLDYRENEYVSDQIRIENEEIYCHRLCYEEDKEIENYAYPYIVLNDCDKLRRLILEKSQYISSIPVFSYCDERLIQIISEIQLSDLLKILPDNNPFSSLGKNITYFGIGKGFLDFKNIYEKFKEITGYKYSFKLLGIAQEEIKEYQENFAEAIKQYPELLKILMSTKVDS